MMLACRKMLCLAVILSVWTGTNPVEAATSEQKNVLLILTDDFRAEAGVYGSSDVNTPNMDSFAAESLQFNQAYTQIPKCGPERASLLTSRNPTTTNYYYHSSGRAEIKTVKTGLSLPKYFESQDYLTIGSSKIFHFEITNNRYFQRFRWQPVHINETCLNSPALFCEADGESQCPDRLSIDYGKNQLEWIKDNLNGDPFFMAIGIRRPHIRYEVPSSICTREMVDTAVSSVPVPNTLPLDIPEIAQRKVCTPISESSEVTEAGSKYGTSNSSAPYGINLEMEPEVTNIIRNRYFCAVNYIDGLIGELLDKLKELGFENNTIVAITSDHGFSLGESQQWCKMSLFEPAARVPLWIKDPSYSSLYGTTHNQPVELVDLMPTLADLAGVPMSSEKLNSAGMDGRSFAYILRGESQPDEDGLEVLSGAPSKGGFSFSYPLGAAAFTISQRCEEAGCESVKNTKFEAMGYSVRTENYRYTEWREWKRKGLSGDFSKGGLIGAELYDYSDAGEATNLYATNSSHEQALLLSGYLRAHFRDCGKTDTGKLIKKRSLCKSQGTHCVYYKKRCHFKGDCGSIGKASSKTCESYAHCQWKNSSCVVKASELLFA